MRYDSDAELEVRALAESIGFVRVGVARAEPLGPEAEWLRDWLKRGHHGSMQWMERTAEVRVDPTDSRMVNDAQSVIVLVAPYGRDTSIGRIGPLRIAKYAVGRDYHNVLTKRATRIATRLHARGYDARVAIDSKPVFERAWAQRSGVGFVGKNCCLIVPGVGSHVFLACVITTAPLTPSESMSSRCGTCSLCLTSCPTNAFVASHQLDARRCISYLTIEHDGAIQPELRNLMGSWSFGCDACQDVCPYNHTKAHTTQPEPDLAPRASLLETDAEWYLNSTDDEFNSRFEGSPLRRSGAESMARNVAITLGNTGERRYLPVLQHAASSHRSHVVREAASWAVEQINKC